MVPGSHILSAILLLVLASSNHKAQAVMLKTLNYDVNGDVTINGGKIIVDNFGYTGGAPDAFFYVGTSGCPSGEGTLIQYPAGDADRPLGPYTGQRVELDLPAGINKDEVAWVSVWCRQYKLDLGHALLSSATDMAKCGSSQLGMFVPTLAILLLFVALFV